MSTSLCWLRVFSKRLEMAKRRGRNCNIFSLHFPPYHFFPVQVDRIIPAATHEQMTQFGHVFAERTRRDLADGHLWFSVLARPPQSRFTCVQRVSCCLCLLYATMLANAMFYRTSSKSSETSSGFSVGPFTLTPEQVLLPTLFVRGCTSVCARASVFCEGLVMFANDRTVHLCTVRFPIISSSFTCS